ncbi:ADP-ribosylglycohydrolase family protein [Pectobacterium brasiliense]|uniref:ADP-ribosylglycohydrolase family protein n=1 Tax=Pectobacterium brasiliense TaxID=180957 RepID=UPI00196A1B66|nr:ADP-ribosylglycohydrolase family protein [Pectobacterium brasiliense]MBN3340825.1 ADP-ribosylglycohydrolase family protein [Pectobacterium brasiliense]
MQNIRLQRTISSALWSAYADALGFPTELASSATVERRIGRRRSERSIEWKRMIGGRSGTMATLPAGSYSDDTQLRLATSRAIRSDGFFDVESFAKVELPTWLSYALGAGRGSKDAAGSLVDRNVTWFSNFFGNYVNGGGNGAAMRIQPHVWSAKNINEISSFLPDVVRNAICTHGHMRGILGAIIHALSLSHVYSTGEIPGPVHWKNFSDVIARFPDIIHSDYELSTFWLPTWEAKSGMSLTQAINIASREWRENVDLAIKIISEEIIDTEATYTNVVDFIGGFSDAERGSGLKCALFANVAAFLYGQQGTKKAIDTVVNLLGSDTDTIGTMTGAMMGARYYDSLPDDLIQDRDYIISEAERLYKISQGISVETHVYPDLLYWQPAKLIVDMLSCKHGVLNLAGLSEIKKIHKAFSAKQKGISWVWVDLKIGQSILCKARDNVLSATNSSYYRNEKNKYDKVSSSKEMEKFIPLDFGNDHSDNHIEALVLGNEVSNEKSSSDAAIAHETLEKITDDVIKSGFDPDLIGRKLLEFSTKEDGLELAIGFTAIIIKAKSARLKKNITS